MIDPQTWPPLCGAVAGCGALLVLSGAAKLVRTVRGTGGGTAVQQALRLSDAPWRVFQGVAGTAELVIGLLVCARARPAVADALMAAQGVVFVALLGHVLRNRIPGDCGCVARRRPAAPGKSATTRWSVARAVFIALAGGAGAAAGVRSPSALPHSGEAFAWAVVLATSVLLAAVDLELRTPHCRRAFLFPVRTTLAEVTDHTIYRTMAASLGATGEHVLFRRAGCVDEFWFPAPGSGPADRRYLEVRAGRTAAGALALRAAVAEQVPPGRVRTLPVRPGSARIRRPPAGHAPPPATAPPGRMSLGVAADPGADLVGWREDGHHPGRAQRRGSGTHRW